MERSCLSLVVLVALAGCAVGPNYRPPQPVTPDEWHSQPTAAAPAAATPAGDSAPLADWWKTVNHLILDQLVEQALTHNKTAKQAYASVLEARARRGIAAADFWPTLNASAGGNRTNSESRVSNPDVGLAGGTDEI